MQPLNTYKPKNWNQHSVYQDHKTTRSQDNKYSQRFREGKHILDDFFIKIGYFTYDFL